jgi:FAD/FMN-containing dehydrogenase
LFSGDAKKIWTLRKRVWDCSVIYQVMKKLCLVIEDTAVDVNDLPAYIREFNEILKKYNL